MHQQISLAHLVKRWFKAFNQLGGSFLIKPTVSLSRKKRLSKGFTLHCGVECCKEFYFPANTVLLSMFIMVLLPTLVYPTSATRSPSVLRWVAICWSIFAAFFLAGNFVAYNTAIGFYLLRQHRPRSPCRRVAVRVRPPVKPGWYWHCASWRQFWRAVCARCPKIFQASAWCGQASFSGFSGLRCWFATTHRQKSPRQYGSLLRNP